MSILPTARRVSASGVSLARCFFPAPVLLAVLVGLGVTPPCLADMPAWVEVGEMMMQAQGCDAAFLGRYFGPDDGNILQFTWSGDNSAKTFTYSLQPGATYLGAPLSLSCTGAFNPSTATWGWVSTGQHGDFTWQATGSGVITGDPEAEIDVQIPIPFTPYIFDFHNNVRWWPADDPPIMIWESEHSMTFTQNDIVIGGPFEGGDMTNTAPGEFPALESFTWDLPQAMAEHDFSVASASSQYGSFTMAVTPEPGAMVLAVLAGVLFGRQRQAPIHGLSHPPRAS